MSVFSMLAFNVLIVTLVYFFYSVIKNVAEMCAPAAAALFLAALAALPCKGTDKFNTKVIIKTLQNNYSM